jgi:hypothetical protein
MRVCVCACVRACVCVHRCPRCVLRSTPVCRVSPTRPVPPCPTTQLSDRQLDELTAVCNRYPDISVTTELPDGPDVPAGELGLV